ncbi:MAG TPA: hypothetical protein PKM41_01650 [Deltaproteobacteria bacterium]|jgi:hypothetical protein|nr:hypothetical protein [Deltaproteobacteria bacterium]HOI07063.1 hypothetical protein [Deltaproteobacteria bacterium]
MRGIHRVAGQILLCAVFVAVALPVPGLADELTMQLPPVPKFTYRITADNRIIRPGPLEFRFARKDSSPFCGKIVEVGMYTSTASSNVGFYDPPGSADPQSTIFTSLISGGAALCNFNYNDNVVKVAMEPRMEYYLNDTLTAWSKPGIAPMRRKQLVLTPGMLPFKVFLKGNNGGYGWRQVISTNPLVTIDQYGRGYIPVEIVCDPIPNTPPVAHLVTLSTGSVPAGGGPVDITIIAYDDNKVNNITATADTGYTTSKAGFIRTSVLGMTPGGLQISEWKCTHYIQANLSPSPRTHTLSFTLTDGEGGVTTVTGANAKFVQQAGTPDTTPPTVQLTTVAPLSLPAAGGVVTVSVRAADNDKVSSAVISLARPDGQTTPVTMYRASGTAANGEWRYSWTVGPNTRTSPQTYGIRVTLTDASGNTAGSQPYTLTVAGSTPPAVQSVRPTGPAQIAAPKPAMPYQP